MDKRGGESRSSVENFLSHSAQNFQKGILHRCINLTSGSEKVWIGGGGGYHDFPSNFFCLTVPNIFVEQSLTVAIIPGIDKVWIRKGEYQDFPSKTFCLTMPKIYVRESFIVALTSVTEKVWIGGGGIIRIFRRNFCLTVPKFSIGESFTVALVSGGEKVFGQGGESIKIFHGKFLSLSAEHFRRGILCCCSNVAYRKCLDKKGEYQDFPSKIFCLIVPKISVAESFFVALTSGTEKVWKRGCGGVSRFPVGNF